MCIIILNKKFILLMKQFLKNAGKDIPASIVVFLVALPLCLGVAQASGAPLFSGLIAGFIGGIVVGSLSGSHLSVSGPAAGLTTIVGAAILKLPSFEVFLLAVFVCGILQLLLGLIKAGFIGDYVPSGVIKGMLAAIGLILILNQFPHLLGDDSHFEIDDDVPAAKGDSGPFKIFINFFNSFKHIHYTAIVIGGVCLIFHFIWEKIVSRQGGFLKLVPAPFLVVIIGVVANSFIPATMLEGPLTGQHLVYIKPAESVKDFFSFFTFPDFSHFFNSTVLVTGATLAIVASLETLLSIEAVDELDPYQRVTNKDRELRAQGVANMFSGLVGGLPVTSVIVRSSANVNAGAQTKLSAIMHGMLLLLCVAFIPNILNLIPKAALAAILIYTGYKLAKPSLFKIFYAKGWDQFIPFVVTIAAILLTDLLKGVLIGIAVGLFFIMRSNFKSSVFIVNDAHKFLVRLRKDVSFLNKPIIKNRLETIPENSTVIIDATRADFIDKDVIEVINDFMQHAHLKNITVEIKKSDNKSMHLLFNEQPVI